MRVGIDVGGTMTDLIAYDPVTGEIIAAKTHSTPPHIYRGSYKCPQEKQNRCK
jgi:N-methylhydantoinase A/oxoprolinase/acetone carboxylase beta subunit